MHIKDPMLAELVEEWQSKHESRGEHVERRIVEIETPDMEMRVSFDGPRKGVITGYAAVFNQPTQLWEGFREQVAPGAFKSAIGRDDVRALWNHNPDYVLGRTKSGTLTLSEDERGLKYEIIPPDTTWARDLQTLIKRHDVSQSSFGFSITKENVQRQDEGKQVLRTILDVKLFDVSPVTFPAYKDTEVKVRMIAGEYEYAFVFEDGRSPIVVSDEERAQAIARQDDAQMDADWRLIKEAAIRPRGK